MSGYEQFLKSSLNKYKHPDIAKRDVLSVFTAFGDLRPKVDDFVFNDGTQKTLLLLDGTIPVNYRGSVYNIPICIWLLDTHPYNPPMVFVRPTSTMRINPSRNVDMNGKIDLPYLREWKYPSSDLLGMIQILTVVFGEETPMYSEVQPPQQAARYPGSTPYPPSGKSGETERRQTPSLQGSEDNIAVDIFRRNISRSVAAAHALRNQVTAAVGNEPVSRLPTQGKRIGSQRPRRNLTRTQPDRRRDACMKVGFTALDRPNINSTQNIKMAVLNSKGLGRRPDTTVQLELSTTYLELCEKGRDLFPVLFGFEIQLLLGRRECRLEPLEEDTTLLQIKQTLSGNSFARIWIRPTEPVNRIQMRTPTISARIPASDTSNPPDDHSLTNTQTSQPSRSSLQELPALSDHSYPGVIPSSSRSGVSATPALNIPDASAFEPNPPVPGNMPSSETTQLFTSGQDGALHATDVANEPLAVGIQQLRGSLENPPVTILVQRNNIFETVLSAYENLRLQSAIIAEFVGEDGEDQGGLTRDMFSAFWEAAYNIYFTGEDTVVPRAKPADRSKARQVFPVIGKILEHTVLYCGAFPLRMSRVTMLMLAHPDNEIDRNLLIEEYIKLKPVALGALLRKCLRSTAWSDNEKQRLLRFYSVSGLACLPSPANLKMSIENLAQQELVDETLAFVGLIRRGFSYRFRNFLASVAEEDLTALTCLNTPTPEKVAELIDNSFLDEDILPEEEAVVCHLSNFIRELTHKQLRTFLLWATGSSNMPSRLSVAFSGSYGIERCPVAHTCGNVLELPVTYLDYTDFKMEFLSILGNQEAMCFTTL